jgi:hypothetical protein
MRESEHHFKLFYDTKYVCLIVAHTKWEAIEKAYSKFIFDHPYIDRKKLQVKKIY